MRKMFAAAVRFALWARTPVGRHDLAGAVAVVTAIYTAFHRSGV